MALAVMMFVSVPLVLMLQWLSKAVYAHEYLIQDQMSILQLRFYISQCESWQLFDNEIHVVFEKKEYQLQFHQGNDSLRDLVTKFSCIRSNKENLR